MSRFHAYVPCEKSHVEFEVTKKIVTDVRGHFTYMLQGITDKGNKANALVNKTIWERFDVPITEKKIECSFEERKKKRMRYIKGTKDQSKHTVSKYHKKVYNEEIEQWLAEHNGIDFNSLNSSKDDFPHIQ